MSQLFFVTLPELVVVARPEHLRDLEELQVVGQALVIWSFRKDGVGASSRGVVRSQLVFWEFAPEHTFEEDVLRFERKFDAIAQELCRAEPVGCQGIVELDLALVYGAEDSCDQQPCGCFMSLFGYHPDDVADVAKEL